MPVNVFVVRTWAIYDSQVVTSYNCQFMTHGVILSNSSAWKATRFRYRRFPVNAQTSLLCMVTPTSWPHFVVEQLITSFCKMCLSPQEHAMLTWPEDQRLPGQSLLSCWYQRFTYSYMNRVLKIGAKQLLRKDGTYLGQDDLYRVPQSMESKHLTTLF